MTLIGAENKMNKSFSTNYSDIDLADHEEPRKNPEGKDDFLVMVCSWHNGNDNKYDWTRLWYFKNKLHALQFFLKFMKLKEKEISAKDYGVRCRKLNEAIKIIQGTNSDRNVFLDCINYATESSGLVVRCEGYWQDAVPQVLDYLWEYFLEQASSEDELEIAVKKLEELNQLIKVNRINDREFMESFHRMCQRFGIFD